MAKKAPAPFGMSAVRNVDYVTAGETYQVEVEGKRFHFRNVRTGGATSLPAWQVGQAVRDGALEYTQSAAERRAMNGLV